MFSCKYWQLHVRTPTQILSESALISTFSFDLFEMIPVPIHQWQKSQTRRIICRYQNINWSERLTMIWTPFPSVNRMLALRVVVIHIWTCHSFTPRASSSLQRSWFTRRELSTDATAAASLISSQFQVPNDKRLLIHWKWVFVIAVLIWPLVDSTLPHSHCSSSYPTGAKLTTNTVFTFAILSLQVH